jgi:hypothetical protein
MCGPDGGQTRHRGDEKRGLNHDGESQLPRRGDRDVVLGLELRDHGLKLRSGVFAKITTRGSRALEQTFYLQYTTGMGVRIMPG